VFTGRLGLADSATPADTIPPGAVGEALTPQEAAEYGDSHLLRVITRRMPDGTLLMPTSPRTGTRLALMRRDEERIFRNLDVMMRQIREAVAGREVVAVFHADCGARGRLTLDRVAKDEIVKAMQSPLSSDGAVGPWLGMYGFGEFARLGGRNRFHNYTTALYVITR
jgi:small ligand-binding sensory domain FIST